MSKPLYRLLGAAGLTACAGVTPYDADFSCRSTDYGQCVHPEGAYALALAKGGGTRDASAIAAEPVNRRQRRTRAERRQAPQGADPAPASPAVPATPYDGYQQAVYRELSGMIDQPVTPMLTQPKVVRTLIMPYADTAPGGALYMPRFVYSILEGPRFVLGDYLSDQQKDEARRFALPRREGSEPEASPGERQ